MGIKDLEIALLNFFLVSHPKTYKNALVVGLDEADYLETLKDKGTYLVGVGQTVEEKYKKFLNEYHNESLFLLDLEPVDFLISLSYLNTVGVIEAKNHLFEYYQLEYFSRLISLAKGDFFISFLYGQPNLYAGDYSIIHREMLDKMLKIGPMRGVEVHFFATGDTDNINSWSEVDQKIADTFYSNPQLKEKCLCLMMRSK